MTKWILLFVMTFSALAENLYVTPSGAGANDGSNWSNAFAGFDDVSWGSGAGHVGSGDTLWVAGGSYSKFTVGASGTADNNRVTLKRARSTNSECSSVTGWSAGFDSQVIQTIPNNFGERGINIPQSYVTVDGQISEGWKIVNPNDVGGYDHGVYSVGDGNNFTYLWLAGGSVVGEHRGFSCDNGGSGSKTGLLISYCKITGVDSAIFIVAIHDAIVEYTEISDNKYSTGAYHANLMYIVASNDGILRYNRFSDWVDQGVGFWGPGTQDGWKIYGNIWYNAYDYGVRTSPAIVFGPYDNSWGSDWFIYNNTFSGMAQSIRGNGGQGGTVPGGQVKNNLFFNAPTPDWSNLTHDYNWYESATDSGESNGVAGGVGNDPFVDSSGGDYHILSTISATMPRQKGATLGSEYEIDMDGVNRGSDGLWAIGTFAYVNETVSTYSGVVRGKVVISGRVVIR